MMNIFKHMLVVSFLMSCSVENPEVWNQTKYISINTTIGGDPCYRFGVTKEECEANEGCSYSAPLILYVLKENKSDETYGYQYNLVFAINGGTVSYNGFTMCSKVESEHSIQNKSNFAESLDFCIQMAPSIWLTRPFYDDDLDKVPPGWRLCSELDMPEMNTDGGCGNGVIEPGETCDGTEFGAPSDCAEYSEATGEGDYTGGEIYCSGCLRRFDQCTPGSKQGE